MHAKLLNLTHYMICKIGSTWSPPGQVLEIYIIDTTLTLIILLLQFALPSGFSAIFSWWPWFLSYSSLLQDLSGCCYSCQCLVLMPFFVTVGFSLHEFVGFKALGLRPIYTPFFSFHSLSLLCEAESLLVVWKWFSFVVGFGILGARIAVGDSPSIRLLDIVTPGNLLSVCFYYTTCVFLLQ